MQVEFTAVYRKVPEGCIGFVEELPGANTQGATLDEARENLREAALLVLEANRQLASQGDGAESGAIIADELGVVLAIDLRVALRRRRLQLRDE
jgi:predicted RNase H-like HicB family nuclease